MIKQKNVSIHGLRGLASILVVFYHIYGMAYVGGFFAKREVEGFYILVNNLGSMSVNLFFMISGFLIVGSLARHKNVKNFLVNRVIRIYPVFLALHLVIFMFGPFINYEWLGDVTFREYITGFVSNLFLLPGIFDLPLAQKNAWSLSYEFAFYIITSLFFLTALNVKNDALKALSLISIGTITISIIFFHHTTIFFVLGVLVFYAKNLVGKFFGESKYFYLNGVILIPTVFVIYNQENVLSLLPLVLCVILFWSVINEEGLLGKILSSRLFQFLGTISYSLYLVHPFALFPLKIIFSMGRIQEIVSNEYIRLFLFGTTGVLLSLIASYISYNLLEDKLTTVLKARNKKTNSKKVAGVVAPIRSRTSTP